MDCNQISRMPVAQTVGGASGVAGEHLVMGGFINKFLVVLLKMKEGEAPVLDVMDWTDLSLSINRSLWVRSYLIS